jgi:hypothetical protein
VVCMGFALARGYAKIRGGSAGAAGERRAGRTEKFLSNGWRSKYS